MMNTGENASNLAYSREFCLVPVEYVSFVAHASFEELKFIEISIYSLDFVRIDF